MLGSEEVPSQFVPDPNGPQEEEEEETAVREITFWKDGFSIQDGPLLRYDDPVNSQILQAINSGYVYSSNRLASLVERAHQECPTVRFERPRWPTRGAPCLSSSQRSLRATTKEAV